MRAVSFEHPALEREHDSHSSMPWVRLKVGGVYALCARTCRLRIWDGCGGQAVNCLKVVWSPCAVVFVFMFVFFELGVATCRFAVC